MQLHAWYDSQIREEEEDVLVGTSEEALKKRIKERIDLSMKQQINPRVFRLRRRAVRWIAAASFIFFLIGPWIQRNEGVSKPLPTKIAAVKNTRKPGSMLQISDGTSISLDAINDGKFVEGFIKRGDVITVEPVMDKEASISTTFKQKQELVLADGTHVWLNAGSSIRFPIRMSAEVRRVSVLGEAYFEVTHDARRPFIVEAGGIEIKVLGTRFNVDAYNIGKVIKTSLVEGSVVITAKGKSRLLVPGNQAIFNESHNRIDISEVDTDAVTAWKNGLFQFDGVEITSIINEVANWYDVTFEYAGKVTGHSFKGKISRDAELSEVLKILEIGSGLKFTIQGKVIVVN